MTLFVPDVELTDSGLAAFLRELDAAVEADGTDDLEAMKALMRGEKFNPHHEPAGSPEGGQFAESPGGTAVAERPRTGMDALTIEERRRHGQILDQSPSAEAMAARVGRVLRRDDGVAVVRITSDEEGTYDLELTARGLWTSDYPASDVLATHVDLSDVYDETVYGPPDADGPSDLSEEQFARFEALNRYAGSNESIQLNARLRQKDRLTDDQRKWRDALDGAIAMTALPRDVQVYRGISITDYAMVPGTTLTDKAFMSTTLDPTHAAMAAQKLHGGKALLEFTVPKGSKAVYLGAPAGKNWRQSEFEVLLPRGTKLRIIEHTTREFFPGTDAETGARTATIYDVYRAEVVTE